jgi:hypothetical protein
LKKHLGGTHFRTGEELKEEVLSYLRGAAGEFYDSGIKNMVHRTQKCIDLNGDYVENVLFNANKHVFHCEKSLGTLFQC